jgi:putative solute:sodium symporter small subunit
MPTPLSVIILTYNEAERLPLCVEAVRPVGDEILIVDSGSSDGTVVLANQQKHWEKTRSLLFITLAIWFVFSIGIFLFGAEMNEVTGPFGYPWTYWFTCQGSLGAFVILIFWFANRQEKIDEEFGFSEREDD